MSPRDLRPHGIRNINGVRPSAGAEQQTTRIWFIRHQRLPRKDATPGLLVIDCVVVESRLRYAFWREDWTPGGERRRWTAVCLRKTKC